MPATRKGYLDQPDPARFPPSNPLFKAAMAAHDAAVSVGAPTYRDPLSGFQVFTAAVLAERGSCCDSGCRHCPFVGA